MFEMGFLINGSFKVAGGGKRQRTDYENNEDAC